VRTGTAQSERIVGLPADATPAGEGARTGSHQVDGGLKAAGMEQYPMAMGRVKWFDNRKGYGFIEREGEEDVFVHYRNIEGDGFKTLSDGELVEFEIAQGEKGLYALNVRRTPKT
jgi:cold shock protein